MFWSDFVEFLWVIDIFWREFIFFLFILFIVVSKYMYNGEVGE